MEARTYIENILKKAKKLNIRIDKETMIGLKSIQRQMELIDLIKNKIIKKARD